MFAGMETSAMDTLIDVALHTTQLRLHIHFRLELRYMCTLLQQTLTMRASSMFACVLSASSCSLKLERLQGFRPQGAENLMQFLVNCRTGVKEATYLPDLASTRLFPACEADTILQSNLVMWQHCESCIVSYCSHFLQCAQMLVVSMTVTA